MNFLDRLFTFFQNKTLNALGVERDLMELIKAKDISQAMSLMEDHDAEAMQAIYEYNPKLHAIMKRRNKTRKGQEDYRTEKLPRTRQRYINEVELFFLLGNPIKWKVSDESGDADAFSAYKQFLREIRFDSKMRQAKRLAGAETQSAKLYHIYRDEATGLPWVKIVVLSKSNGYTLRPMFDQYGNMLAFGCGYYLKEGAGTVEHFDIHTPTFIFRGRKAKIGWDVTPVLNPTGKINIIITSKIRHGMDCSPELIGKKVLTQKPQTPTITLRIQCTLPPQRLSKIFPQLILQGKGLSCQAKMIGLNTLIHLCRLKRGSRKSRI